MAASSDSTDKRSATRNRTRTVILLALLLIAIVVFGYMLLASQIGQ
jgi:hypothetical protein